jgi:hypothetical protein
LQGLATLAILERLDTLEFATEWAMVGTQQSSRERVD